MSGQQINLDKSVISFSPSVRQEIREVIKDILGLRSSSRLEKYLGMPSIIGKSKKEVFDMVRERVWSKAGSWKGRFLSKAGKEVMLKSILQSIPVYIMGVFRLPEGITNAIRSILHKFWWGNSNNKRPIYWRSWESLTLPKSYGGLGFRDTVDFNTALLAKQAWRLVSQPDSLVSRLLKAKYFPHTSFFDAKLGPNPSYTWRSILSARSLLLEGGRWRVGDGSTIRMWGDYWLPNREVGGLLGPVPCELQHSRISEFIMENTRMWDIGKVQVWVGDADIEDILKVRLPNPPRPDVFCWPPGRHGEYTVRSGYRLLRELPVVSQEWKQLWRAVWHCQVSPKIKHFTWRLISGVLPTRSALLYRHILNSDCCPMCDIQGETMDHVFLHCDWATNVWSVSGISCTPAQSVFTGGIVDWLQLILHSQPPSILEATIVVLWEMWRCRNAKAFENVEWSHAEVGFRAANCLSQFHSAMDSPTPSNSAATPQWQLPPATFHKVNCDGSLLSNGNAGIGVVVRGSGTVFVGALHLHFAHASSVCEVEALAILEGLRFAVALGLPKILVESDSTVVVEEIIRPQPCLSLYGHVVDEIRQVSRLFTSCTFCFIPRICNGVADRLVALGCRNHQPMSWLGNPPACVLDVLEFDS